MSINVTTNNEPIQVSTSGQTVSATVAGGQGPQGPAGPAGPSGISSFTTTGGTVSPLVLELVQQVQE
jgi:hypothetical protein